jgi:hypothetical protein
LHTLHNLWTIAAKIRQDRGTLELLKAGLRFFRKRIYNRELYYLFTYDLGRALSVKETPPAGKNYDLIFKVISENKEADEIEREGFIFLSYPLGFNSNPTTYRRHLLDCGAVAICAFYKQELVALMWEVLSLETQKKVTLPLKVDYSNHEAFTRGAWVNPKYRGLGFYTRTRGIRDRYLAERGVKTIRNTIEISNKMGLALEKSNQSQVYGKATLTRFLFWKFWKEYATDGFSITPFADLRTAKRWAKNR